MKPPKTTTFRSWLRDHGLMPGTVDDYVHDIEVSFRAGGFLVRLRNNELAPKTRRRTLAAARQWATYKRDEKLLEQLKHLRLPPAKRKTAKDKKATPPPRTGTDG